MWVLSFVFKVENRENGHSQFEPVYGFSAVWVLSCVFKSLLCECLLIWAAKWFLFRVGPFMVNQIGAWMVYLLCGPFHGGSNGIRKMISHLCGSFHAPLKWKIVKMAVHNLSRYMASLLWIRQMVSLQCGPFHGVSNGSLNRLIPSVGHFMCLQSGFFHVYSNCFSDWMLCHILNRQMASLLCALSWCIKWEQENGFSPVWVLSCVFKVKKSENGCSQFEQVYGFTDCLKLPPRSILYNWKSNHHKQLSPPPMFFLPEQICFDFRVFGRAGRRPTYSRAARQNWAEAAALE